MLHLCEDILISAFFSEYDNMTTLFLCSCISFADETFKQIHYV